MEATHLTRRCVWSTSTEVYISKHLNSLKDLGLSADVTVENGSYVTYALLKKLSVKYREASEMLQIYI